MVKFKKTGHMSVLVPRMACKPKSRLEEVLRITGRLEAWSLDYSIWVLLVVGLLHLGPLQRRRILALHILISFGTEDGSGDVLLLGGPTSLLATGRSGRGAGRGRPGGSRGGIAGGEHLVLDVVPSSRQSSG